MPDRATETRVDEVEDRLVTAVAVGEYLPASRLPPERELAVLLGVGRVTVRAALARLVDRGLLKRELWWFPVSKLLQGRSFVKLLRLRYRK